MFLFEVLVNNSCHFMLIMIVENNFNHTNPISMNTLCFYQHIRERTTGINSGPLEKRTGMNSKDPLQFMLLTTRSRTTGWSPPTPALLRTQLIHECMK